VKTRESEITREPVNLMLMRFRDKQGQPTCCAEPPKDICAFLVFYGFTGKHTKCGYCHEEIFYKIENGEYTYLQPAFNCPLWEK
jgi:hypothetical protein